MDVAEYTEHDATGLAELIAAGKVSAAEVHDAARTAIESVNGELNALVGPLFDRPLRHDEGGRFAGVPFAIKDLVLHAEGVPQRAGSRMLGPGVPFPYDTALMARFRRAGLAAMGVTATPEFGFNATTESVANGPTRNPWDTTRSPGGSSGGSAALVAARALPVAHANDGGGSVRIPAGACGLVGLKPTRGRTTVAPDYQDPLLGLGVEFAVTRTVRDAAGLLDAVHGAEPGDRYLLPAPASTFAAAARPPSGTLRIAVSTAAPNGAPVDAACVEAVQAVARALADTGHTVEEAAPAYDVAAFDEANLVAWCSFLADAAYGIAAVLGTEPSAEVLEHTTLACAEHGKRLSALDLYAADRAFNATTRAVAGFFTGYDLLLTPTAAAPNTALGHLDADDASLDARGWYDRLFAFAPFTALANVTGAPAISVPGPTSPDGWPVGVMFLGRPAAEETLLGVAALLEEALPWADRRPPVVAH
ncbi:amidase family protein [Blastococcus sp. BMG 814]|uniref:Amidase family protein n=1 Tax=Blastococcus carthaginiensis TaxID=3050034 RepID=A0ABT9IHR3_9ACTN|nr:amidase family protein [Blastococcus carthaginiensis]MDP5185111.1 amidase family protein [Blastococcus carthaginiensis]